jgi:hypothetical protein
MPTTKVLIKEAVTVLDLDNKGKKQIYKSGKHKGYPKMKIKSPAKYRTEIDIHKLCDIFNKYDTICIESQGATVGNSARSSRTTSFNAGIIHAVATMCNLTIHYVAPHKWKKDLRLSKDKLQSIELAEELSGSTFRTNRGRLEDGKAEAYLIRHWFLNHKEIDDD